jgi:hypothetical protein
MQLRKHLFTDGAATAQAHRGCCYQCIVADLGASVPSTMRLIWEIDDNYNVVRTIETFF